MSTLAAGGNERRRTVRCACLSRMSMGGGLLLLNCPSSSFIRMGEGYDTKWDTNWKKKRTMSLSFYAAFVSIPPSSSESPSTPSIEKCPTPFTITSHPPLHPAVPPPSS
jgi:hypothetical protein